MKAKGTYLEKILARTIADLPARKKVKPWPMLVAMAKAAPKAPSFEQSLRRAPAPCIIAELKRKTPLGVIERELDLASAARDFALGGAAALSVVTEGPIHGGGLDDLTRAKQGCKLPLLRQDYIIDEFQVVESRINGASAVVLVAAILEGKQLSALMKAARNVELEAVVEVRDAAELDIALDAGAGLVCLQNREPKGYAADLTISESLAPAAVKAGALVLSSGGIATRDDLRRLSSAGVGAFVIGEALLRAADRAQAVRALSAP